MGRSGRFKAPRYAVYDARYPADPERAVLCVMEHSLYDAIKAAPDYGIGAVVVDEQTGRICHTVGGDGGEGKR